MNLKFLARKVVYVFGYFVFYYLIPGIWIL